MFQRILVPLDGSTFAEAALPAARDLAAKSGAEVRLVTVLDAAIMFAEGDWGALMKDWKERYLDRVAATAFPERQDGVTVTVREGPILGGLIAEADDWNADLIVMTTHGRGAIARAWMGSVADHCVRHSGRPVLLIRNTDGARQVSGGRFEAHRIVVPLDGSEEAEAALGVAMEFEDLFGAELTLLRAVATPVGIMSPYLPQTIELNHEFMKAARDESDHYLGGMAARLKGRGTEVRTRTVADQHPALAILEEAGEDMVVMSTHGRGGLGRFLLGSTADKVVRGARGPVLVLRPLGSEGNRAHGARRVG